MFNRFECIVFLLEKAKEQIRKKEQEYICFAIDDVLCDMFLNKPYILDFKGSINPKRMLQARDAIKEYIKRCLGNIYSYEEWVERQGYPAFNDIYADNLRAGRLAWIDDMIDKASKGLL